MKLTGFSSRFGFFTVLCRSEQEILILWQLCVFSSCSVKIWTDSLSHCHSSLSNLNLDEWSVSYSTVFLSSKSSPRVRSEWIFNRVYTVFPLSSSLCCWTLASESKCSDSEAFSIFLQNAEGVVCLPPARVLSWRSISISAVLELHSSGPQMLLHWDHCGFDLPHHFFSFSSVLALMDLGHECHCNHRRCVPFGVHHWIEGFLSSIQCSDWSA